MVVVTVDEAVRIICSGELLLFPTDTIYGIGCCATNQVALEKLIVERGRADGKPLIVLVSDKEMLKTIVEEIPEELLPLIDRFWPGPLTIVFPAKPSLSSIITAGTKTVAVRIPDCPLLLDVLKKTRCPIVAPSANRSGEPPSLCAQDASDYFPTIAVLDGGPSKNSSPSTVIALSPFRVFREGAIPLSALREYVVTWQ